MQPAAVLDIAQQRDGQMVAAPPSACRNALAWAAASRAGGGGRWLVNRHRGTRRGMWTVWHVLHAPILQHGFNPVAWGLPRSPPPRTGVDLRRGAADSAWGRPNQQADDGAWQRSRQELPLVCRAGGIALAMVLPLHLAFSYKMYCAVSAPPCNAVLRYYLPLAFGFALVTKSVGRTSAAAGHPCHCERSAAISRE
jgi:hypothetical protein